MILNNDVLAIFEEAKKRANKMGLDRINLALVLQILIEQKGYIYIFLTQMLSAKELMNLVAKMVEYYDEEDVISSFSKEEKELIKANGYDLNSNPGVNFTIKVENGEDEIFAITVEFLLFLNSMLEVGIQSVSSNTLEAFFLVGYMPVTLKHIMNKLEIGATEMDHDIYLGCVAEVIYASKKESNDGLPDSMEDKDSFIPKTLEDSLCEFDYKRSIRINARAKEIEAVWNILMKSKDNNVVLVGDEKIGKSAIVEKIAYLINSGQCPKQFKDYRVVKWDLNSIFISSEGEEGEVFSYMKKWLKENKKIILVIDEMPTILESSKMLSISIILKYAIKVFLEDGDNRIIAIASKEEYSLYFEYTNSMPKNFESVEVDEPETDEVFPMIKEQINFLQETHGVKISERNIKYVITIAETILDENNPGKTLKIIEKSLITAKNSLKLEVEKEDILKNCNIDYKCWENLTESNILSTAFHEAGHYIATRLCSNVIEFDTKAVSILPNYDFMGVNVNGFNGKSPEGTIDWIIEHAVCLLAGRVAEKMYTGTISVGAGADLFSATRMVEAMIVQSGMTRFAPNMELDYTFCSDKMKKKVFKITRKIIKKAYKRAEKLLYNNEKLLFKIVKALQENWILSQEELEVIVASMNEE